MVLISLRLPRIPAAYGFGCEVPTSAVSTSMYAVGVRRDSIAQVYHSLCHSQPLTVLKTTISEELLSAADCSRASLTIQVKLSSSSADVAAVSKHV